MSTNTTTTTAITAGRWAIEPAHSEIGFTVRHLGPSKVRGRFNSFSGTVDIANQLYDSTIEVLIDLSSVDTNNDQRDGHLRTTDFFDLETHPQMTFTSTSIETSGSAGTIHGDLTINGVSRAVALDTEFHGVAADVTAPDLPAPTEGFVLTHFIVSQDVPRSTAFYRNVLGGEVVLEGEPTIVKLANGWVTINGGGGPTDDTMITDWVKVDHKTLNRT